MIPEEPQEHLYSWEAELDLYNIQRPDDDRAERLEKGAICVQGPRPKKTLNGHRTPLHRAAQKADSDWIVQLTEVGWSLHVQDREGETALDVYKNTQHQELYENLCERLAPRLPEKQTDGQHQLVLAAKAGQVEKVRDLLSQGVSPMSADKDGRSALYQAVENCYSSVIECLLQANSKELLRQKDNKWQDTPGHRAAFDGRPEIVKKLLKFEPDIEDQQKQGKTALFLTAEWNRSQAAQVLLEHKAQWFTLDELKETPLHQAARNNCIEVLPTLLKADDVEKCLEYKTKSDETPLWLTVDLGHADLARILIKKGASVQFSNNQGVNILENVVEKNLHDFFDRKFDEFGEQKWSVGWDTVGTCSKRTRTQNFLGENRQQKNYRSFGIVGKETADEEVNPNLLFASEISFFFLKT